MPLKRIFVAIDIPEDVRRAAQEHIAGLQAEYPAVKARWVRPDMLHITIFFAGELSEPEREQLIARTADIACGHRGFQLHIRGTRAFTKGRSGVLWLGIDAEPDDSLSNLSREFLAPSKEPHKFTPHLTIARMRDRSTAGGLIDEHLKTSFRCDPFTVKSLTVYESTLLPTGSEYKTLATINFGD